MRIFAKMFLILGRAEELGTEYPYQEPKFCHFLLGIAAPKCIRRKDL